MIPAGARSLSTRASLPERLPPRLGLRQRVRSHPLADLLRAPAGERGERGRLAPATLAHRGQVLLARLALDLSLEGVVQDIAALEVLLVARLLEHEVLGEMLGVVSDVQSRQRERHAAPADGPVVRLEPEDAQLVQLAGFHRRRRARVAPSHVPDVLGDQRSLAVLLPGAREGSLVASA